MCPLTLGDLGGAGGQATGCCTLGPGARKRGCCTLGPTAVGVTTNPEPDKSEGARCDSGKVPNWLQKRGDSGSLRGRQLHATAALGIWTDEAFGTEASGWSFPGSPESMMPPAPAQRPAPHSGPRGTVGDEPWRSRTPMPRPRDRGAPASSRGDHRAGPVSAS